MEIVLSRADERLVHGEIINEWCQLIKPTHLLIVDDELVEDVFMTNVYCALVPFWLETVIRSVKGAADYLKKHEEDNGRVFLLCRSPKEFRELLSYGLVLTEISVADKRYFPNKIEVPLECKMAINKLIDEGVSVVAQISPESKSYQLNKYSI